MAPPQVRRWCFTINHADPDDDLFDRLCADQRIQRFIIGDECGAAGNLHVQGYMEWKRTMRLAQCKTLIPRAHWEVARASAYDNYKYCSKDGMFATHGDWEQILRKGGQGQEASLQMSDLIQELLRDPRSDLKNHGLYIRHKFAIDARLGELRSRRIGDRRQAELSQSRLTFWQFEVCVKLFHQSKRQILWVFDEEGGKGKTHLSNVLQFCFGFAVLDGVTKTSDVAMLLAGTDYKGVCFDVTRSDANLFGYNTLEAVKNGRLVSGKYQGQVTLLDDVPVVVFANFEPQAGKLSEGRVDLVSLCDEDRVDEEEAQGEAQVGTVPLCEVPFAMVPFV